MTSSMRDLKVYTTYPHSCSYLEDQEATTLFVDPRQRVDQKLYSNLSVLGFRRSGNHIYRPHCTHCEACIPARIPVEQFTAKRGQRRIWNRNQGLVVLRTDDGWGVNFSTSHLYGKWLPFLRAGYSEDAGTLFEKSVSGGVGYLGLGGVNNTLGIAANWSDINDADDQWMSEIYYLWTIVPQLELTFNYQWIEKLALNNAEDDIAVAGIRLRLTL